MDATNLRGAARSTAGRVRNRVLVALLRSLRGPVSSSFGFDRGTPLDRPHIEAFLLDHAADLRGHVLEVKEALYSWRLGGDQVTSVDVIDIDAGNTRATVHGDLADPALLRPEAYDCIVLTQTLQFLQPARALPNLYAALRPGGTLLLTAPALCRVETQESDLWRLPPAGLDALLRAHLPAQAAWEVAGHGNAVVAAAFMLGLSLEDVGADLGGGDDWRFPIVTTARIRKSARDG